MSFLNAIKSASARRTSEFIQPGRYLLEVKNLVEGETRNGDAFICLETRVIDSNDLDRHPVGSERSYMVMTGRNKETAAKNVRSMLNGILGTQDQQLTAAMVDRAFSVDDSTGLSVLAGCRVIAHARNVLTKRGTDFTLVDWISCNEDTSRLP